MRDAHRRLLAAAWAVWAITGLIVGVLVAREPVRNSVTPVFRTAVRTWWSGGNLYPSGEAGFIYFPQSAILYTPFTWGPVVVGELLWRLVCLSLFASGLWRMVRLVTARKEPEQPQINPDEPRLERAGSSPSGSIWAHPWPPFQSASPGLAFLIATLLCLPLAASNLRNGQFNLPLAALMLHGAADLALGRWWRASLALCLMTALKPLGLVMVLLAAVVYPRTAWRLATGMLIVAALPLIHPDTAYAMEMYRAALRTMDTASKVELEHGQDLRGIFAALHVEVPLFALTAVRLAAAPLVLAIAWLAKRRRSEPAGAVFTLAAAGVYLTLFNPRCEGLTYAVLSPAIGTVLIGARARRAVVSLLLIGLAVAISKELTGGLNTWVRPCAAAAFLGLLLAFVSRGAAWGQAGMAENRPSGG